MYPTPRLLCISSCSTTAITLRNCPYRRLACRPVGLVAGKRSPAVVSFMPHLDRRNCKTLIRQGIADSGSRNPSWTSHVGIARVSECRSGRILIANFPCLQHAPRKSLGLIGNVPAHEFWAWRNTVAGAFLISRLGGSRRRFGRTIALWGLNRFLLFAAPSVLVPPDQSTHRPCIVLPRQRRRNRPDKPKTYVVRLPQSGFVQVALWEAQPG